MNKENKSNVSELAAELSGDASMPDRMVAHEKATRMVTLLADCRVRKGMTQKKVAERMGVSVSTVSRFEDSQDADIRMGELVAYAEAVGVNLSLIMEDSDIPTAARIKNCVMRISNDLHHLSHLAANSQGDQGIIDGIHRFRGEVLFNFLLHYEQSGTAMPSRIVLFEDDDTAQSETENMKGSRRASPDMVKTRTP